MKQASVLDGYERRANQFFSNAIQTPRHDKGRGKHTWKPRLYTPKEENYGEPMQID
jgi:hypothetical protein